jgi:hypothetical protein
MDSTYRGNFAKKTLTKADRYRCVGVKEGVLMSIFGRVSAAALVAGFTLGMAGAAQAVTFDAFTAFDGTSSVSGPFSFGSIDPTTNIFTLLGAGNCAAYISDTVCRGTLPGVYKTSTGAHVSGSVIVPADKLILHPGDGVNGLLAAIEFTAPTAGNYFFDLTAAQSDTDAHSQTAFVLADFGSGIFGVAGDTLTTSHTSTSFSGGTLLTAGQKVIFAISNDNGSYFDDSTAVSFQVEQSAVPEPASWAMMIGGFGMIGAAMRRRQRTVVRFS